MTIKNIFTLSGLAALDNEQVNPQEHRENREKCQLFLEDFTKTKLTSTELLLCDYAYELTVNPDKINNDNYIYHGEFLFTQECHHFINVRKIDWWVDFI